MILLGFFNKKNIMGHIIHLNNNSHKNEIFIYFTRFSFNDLAHFGTEQFYSNVRY